MDKDNKRKKKLYIFLAIISIIIIILFFYFWNKKEAISVSFVLEDGTVFSSQQIDSSSGLVKPPEPKKEGYVFEGWYLDGEKFNFDTEITEDMILVARWSEVEDDDPDLDQEPTTEKYTINFNSNGGSKVSSLTVEKGSTITKPKNPTRKGYTFVAWQVGGKNYDFSQKVTKDLTLVAKWEKSEASQSSAQPVTPTTFKISFNSNGGTQISSQTIKKGSTLTKPQDPVKSGYIFKGWLLNNSAYNFNSPVNSNFTLIASWEKIDVYTVQQSNFQLGSPQIIVTVYKNGSVIAAKRVLTSSGLEVGTYDSEYKVILVELHEYDRIAKAELNDGTIVNVTRK